MSNIVSFQVADPFPHYETVGAALLEETIRRVQNRRGVFRNSAVLLTIEQMLIGYFKSFSFMKGRVKARKAANEFICRVGITIDRALS